MSTKRIGLVDKTLDNYHANVFLKCMRGELAGRGFEIVGATAMDAEPSRQWAQANGLKYYDDADSLGKAVDCFMVLAPSNPELHLELCEQVCPFGKPTYVDKTFAPDLVTAKRIFELADRHGTPMQSSSVLRYTNVQDMLSEQGEPAKHVVTWGNGRSVEEYAIHPLELAVSCMGAGATRMMRRGTADRVQLLLDYPDGRTAVVNVYVNHATPFAAAITTAKATHYAAVDGAAMWAKAMAGILDFFEAGKPNIDRAQTLLVMAARDAILSDASSNQCMCNCHSKLQPKHPM